MSKRRGKSGVKGGPRVRSRRGRSPREFVQAMRALAPKALAAIEKLARTGPPKIRRQAKALHDRYRALLRPERRRGRPQKRRSGRAR